METNTVFVVKLEICGRATLLAFADFFDQLRLHKIVSCLFFISPSRFIVSLFPTIRISLLIGKRLFNKAFRIAVIISAPRGTMIFSQFFRGKL